jgi:N-acetyl-gamma-glutamylphosphate reductase
MATCFSESLVNGPKLEGEPTKQKKSAHRHDPEMVEQAAVTTNHEFTTHVTRPII